MQEKTRGKLIIIAAILFWVTAALNVVQLILEGSTFSNWLWLIFFVAMAVYFSYLALGSR